MAATLKSVELSWKLANYRCRAQDYNPGEYIVSEVITIKGEGDLITCVNLEIYPNDPPEDNEPCANQKWTDISIKVVSKEKFENDHDIEFYIMDANGEKFYGDYFGKCTPDQISRGYRKFIRQRDLENPIYNLLPNDTLTVCCRIQNFDPESKDYLCPNDNPQTQRTRNHLAQDLASLLVNQENHDVQFSVKNVHIPAHKSILVARSPVFAAMFRHDMQEVKTGEVEIPDIEPVIFKRLLEFIYTGFCEVADSAEQLLIASEKYNINDLKDICESELRKKLTFDNIVHLLVLSDLHQAKTLKRSAILFINRNAAQVVKQPSWKNLTNSHPHLVVDLWKQVLDLPE